VDDGRPPIDVVWAARSHLPGSYPCAAPLSGPGAYTATVDLRHTLVGLVSRYSESRRHVRGELFLKLLAPTAQDSILDLGSEDGDHIAAIVPFRENVTIADIDATVLERGHARHGFRTALLDESGRLPFGDGEFDIVFCSSVIEHVTVDKTELATIRSGRAFASASWEHQREFADEIRRVAKRYFVQTPNKWFPIESHTWLPLPIVLLPRPLQLRLVAWLNKWWIKPTQVDWNLLTASEMATLFPDATIVPERTFGLCKSLIAVKR
jgi:SAM-dependent methyltransferase